MIPTQDVHSLLAARTGALQSPPAVSDGGANRALSAAGSAAPLWRPAAVQAGGAPAPAASGAPLAAVDPQRMTMFDTGGQLNVSALKQVLGGVRQAIGQLSPQARGPSHAQRVIDKAQRDLIQGGGAQAYDVLKHVGHAIEHEARTPEMKRLGAAVIQMARVQNYQQGIARYDDDAQAATQRVLKANPTLESRSGAYSLQQSTLGANGGATVGFAAGPFEGATAGGGAGLRLDRSAMLANDEDTDLLYVTRHQATGTVKGSARLGAVSDALELGGLTAGVSAKGTRGAVVDGSSVGQVVNYAVMQHREGVGGHGSRPGPGATRARHMANTPTRGLGAQLRRAADWLTHHGDRVADGHPELTTRKLAKGADPASYLVGQDSLLHGIDGCRSLQARLDSAYGGMAAREMPAALKPIVGDGQWLEVEGAAAAGAELAKVSMPGGALNATGLAADARGAVSHRWLPFRLWMAPHAALESLSDGHADAKQDLLNQVRRADPDVAGYLDRARQGGAAQVRDDLRTFQDGARELLCAQAVCRGGDSSKVLKAHAQGVFDRSLATLRDSFGLGEREMEGVAPDSDRLEHLLARCWNRLSLGLAQVDAAATTPQEKEQVKQLDDAIRQPGVFMAPTHLYHAASVQMDATLKRLRAQGEFTLTLPQISAGSAEKGASATLAGLGSLRASVTRDTVSQHPNIMRNGDFLTFEVSASHLPLMGGMDKLANELARQLVRRIQPETDRPAMGQAERDALVGSISASLASALGEGGSPSGGVSGSGGTARSFEVALHRGAAGDGWKLAMFKSFEVASKSLGVNGQASFAAGVGGSAGAEIGRLTADARAAAPILGSAPSAHMLQFSRFKAAFFDEAGKQFDATRLTQHGPQQLDAARMYFSNDGLLDMLALVQRLKHDRDADAETLGTLARLPHNDRQYEAFRAGGMPAGTLLQQIADARQATTGMNADQRARFFTGTPLGRELLGEYAASMAHLVGMRSRTNLPMSGPDGRAFTASVLSTDGQRQVLKPAAEQYTRF